MYAQGDGFEKVHFFPKLFEKRFFPFERIPFLCLESSDEPTELERFKESEAWGKERREEEREGRRRGRGRKGRRERGTYRQRCSHNKNVYSTK